MISMEWIRGRTIGRGSTATVSLATAISSGELFAVKSTELSRSMLLQREQQFLSQLSCPHIVKYMGFDISYENSMPLYNLCMEYVPGGTLYEAIRRHRGRLDEPMIRAYTKQILQGLEYLHATGLVHCDIKSQNILIGEDGSKIADLGCAKLVGKVDGDGDSARSEISGTPLFMSPEVARGEGQGFSADIWALGCTVIEMATGSTPWPELNDPVSALYRIGFSGDAPEIPRWLSEKAKDFLSNCFRRNPSERWTAKELLQHPFLAETAADHSIEIKGFTTSSPSSVLEQCFWDSLEVSEFPRNQTQESGAFNSPAERINRLIEGSVPSVSCVPNWTCDEHWITVRSNDTEENEKFTEELDLVFADEITVATTLVIDLPTQLEEFGSSMFDEDLLNYSVESISTLSTVSIRRGFVMGSESVEDDIVMVVSNSETDNENFCFLQFKLFHLNPKRTKHNVILFVQIFLLYNIPAA